MQHTQSNLTPSSYTKKKQHYGAPHKQSRGKVCTKNRYCSEKSAKKALRNQQKWRARVCRVYRCPECKRFHLTSSKSEWNDG